MRSSKLNLSISISFFICSIFTLKISTLHFNENLPYFFNIDPEEVEEVRVINKEENKRKREEEKKEEFKI